MTLLALYLSVGHSPGCAAVWGGDGTLGVEPYWRKDATGGEGGADFGDLKPHSTSSSVILFTAHS